MEVEPITDGRCFICPACTSPVQELGSEVAVEGCFSACKVSGTDGY